MALEDMGIDMPPEAKENLKNPSESIQIVLMSRLAEMTPEELMMLDKAITPDVMCVLVKLLPELEQLINQIGETQEETTEPAPEMPEDNMGALRNMA